MFPSLQDLAQYVNEVKRDIETLRDIDQYQKSIENLVSKIMVYTDYYLKCSFGEDAVKNTLLNSI